MAYSELRSHRAELGLALLVTVATQIFYITVISGGENVDGLRMIVWTLEAITFSVIAMTALVLSGNAAFSRAAFAAIAIGAVTNIIQVGMGLAEFGPAREAADEAVFGTVIAGAFFLYFHGKAMFGLAAILISLALFARLGGIAKILAGLTGLAGLIAAIINVLGMAQGMEFVQIAGATGTLSTALLGVLLLIVPAKLMHGSDADEAV